MPRVESSHANYLVGDLVTYVGTDIIPVGYEGDSRPKYSGALRVWARGTGYDFDACACLSIDNKVTGWILYTDLHPFGCWRKSRTNSKYSVETIAGDRVRVVKRDAIGTVHDVILRSDRREELATVLLSSGVEIRVLPRYLEVLDKQLISPKTS